MCILGFQAERHGRRWRTVRHPPWELAAGSARPQHLSAPLLVLTLVTCLLAGKVGGADTGRGSVDRPVAPREASVGAAARVLIVRCLECHGEARKAALDLRTRRAALAGGESGAAVHPGRPDRSLLLQRVDAGEMPPNEPLDADERAVLRRWIAAGAPYPAEPLDPYAFTSEQRAGYDWWALQPIRRPALPRGSRGQLRGRIDVFVAKRLEVAGIRPVEAADRAVLIRRVTYDLTGLQPTPEQVDAFVRDPRPDAYERLVDRLLASPHYGERWARHWLDVVRYAESNGFERDRIRRNVWHYRDYVIEAFNANTPFDVFVLEQLAGDALRPDDPRMRVATGFLALGPKNDVATISELERLKTRQDELDDVVTGTMVTFAGLTVGCARCHDHKYDPIPTRDYYALTAVFSGCRHDPAVEIATAEQRRQREALLAKIDRELAASRQRRQDLLDAVIRRADSAASEEGSRSGLPVVDPRRNEDTFSPVTARFVRFTILATNRGEPCLDELEVYGADGGENLALASRGGVASASSLLPGYAIHQVSHLNDGRHGNAHSWISNEPGRGWAQVDLGRPQQIERVVWGRDRQGRYADRLAVAYVIAVSVDGRTWRVVSGSWRRPPFPGVKAEVLRNAEAVALLSPEQRKHLDALDAAIAALQQRRRDLPPLPTTYGIRDGAGAARVPVLLRGDVRRHGPLVSAAALSAVRALPSGLAASDGPQRRLKLARWLVDPRNPLTARVFVNRVWQWHFGRGIVATPNDFGFKGARPSHPALLDELASAFVASGWDIKQLHRRIVLSATYRRGSRFDPDAAAVDRDNRLLWRMPPRRLDAEAVWDILLQLAGDLDESIGGPSFATFVYRDGNVPDYVRTDLPGHETHRRAVYRFNIRTYRFPVMAAFDCPDPSVSTPRRVVSTTPLQALTLLNNPFCVRCAERLAARVQAAHGADVAGSVRAVFRRVLLRDPSPEELSTCTRIAKEFGLRAVCRALINSNEFLYVP